MSRAERRESSRREREREKKFLQAIDGELSRFWSDPEILGSSQNILDLSTNEFLNGAFVEPVKGYSSLLNLFQEIVSVDDLELRSQLLKAQWRLSDYYSCMSARNKAYTDYNRFVEDQSLLLRNDVITKEIQENRRKSVIQLDGFLRSSCIEMIAVTKELHRMIGTHINRM